MGDAVAGPLSFARAIEAILAHAPAGERIVDLPIAEAAGLVLGEDVVSDVDLPPFDRAAMDGFAFRQADLACGQRLRLAGSIAAGDDGAVAFAAGECVKIMTGAPLPPGADTVIPVEETSGYAPRDGVVEFRSAPPRGRNVAPRGEDLRAGETALRRGVLLAPHEIALLAAAGRRTARVFDGPRIAYASTGCELREPGEALPRGCIRNSNAYGLAAQIRLARGRPEYAGVLPDEPGALRAGLAKGLEADLLVVSGGVSMGEHDLVPEVLAELGVRILFRRVRVRPGQPTLFGMRDRTLVFGLPGNPLSTLLGFDQYVLPAARIFRHHPQPLAALHAGRLSRSVSKRPGLTALLACGAEWSPEGCVLTPHPTHGSADIVSIRGAHAVAILPEEPAELPCGSTATFRRLYEL